MKNFKKINKNKGMTLVELLVVSIIFIIISSISIFNYNKFNSHISLQNLSDDIALSIRKVQGFAIGAKGTGVIDGFDYSYGIAFSSNDTSLNNPISPYKNSFIIFADINKDGDYTYSSSALDAIDGGENCGSPSSVNECLEILSFKPTDRISRIEVFTGNIDTGTILEANSSMEILFKRPNPEAIFCYKSSLSSGVCDSISSSISRVIIYIQENISDGSTSPREKSITVWSTGQIHIN